MKLIKREKKDYTKNKYLGYFVAISYTLCLLVIRFLDYIEKFVQNRDFLATIAMLAVISIIFLNFTICYASNPNTKLLEQINDFDMGTNNKGKIIEQRNILLKYFSVKEYTKKAMIILCVIESIACLVVFALFRTHVEFANLIVGIIIDIQTVIMAFFFYCDNHYKFKISKNLKC